MSEAADTETHTPPDTAFARFDGSSWLVRVWISPGAKASECLGVVEGRLKLKISAPPVDGKANEALTRFVAKKLGLPKSRVSLQSGESSRKKTLRVDAADISPELLLR